MIVHVLANDGPGGTQAVTLGHVHALAERAAAQTVLFCSQPTRASAVRGALEAANVELRYESLAGSRIAFALRLFNHFRRLRATAVMTHGLGFHVLVAVAARAAGARPTVVLVGNPISPDRADLRTLRRRCRIAAPLVPTVIACSEHVATTVVESAGIDQGAIRVVANPLDVKGVRRRAQASRSARRHDGRSVICTVARLDPIKDHETVIRAVATLLSRGHAVLLRLVGSGPTEARLRELVADLRIGESVEFLGDRDDIPEILGASDVFAFGMTWDEGFGVAVAEAMAARTPIVCTEAGPASEVLGRGRAGLLVPPNDPAAMADGIQRLLENPDLRAELVDAASRMAEERHDFDRLRTQLDEVLGL